MKHFIFASEQKTYEVAVLIKDSHFDAAKLITYYVEPLASLGVAKDKIIAFDLSYDKKKVSAKHINQELNKLMPVLQKIGIKYIYVADAEYFKTLAKQRKADAHIGYVFPCAINPYNYIQVVLGLNYQGLLYNPNQAPKLDLSLATLASVVNKNYQALGLNIIQHEEYPTTISQIATFLTKLHQYPSLTCDIEAFSLNLFKAGIGSISFAWNKNCGGAFLVDYIKQQPNAPCYGRQINDKKLKFLLKDFFVNYKGNLKFHNATYDIKVLILNLFMKSKQDYQGMLYGLEVMCRHIDDTKIIAYLALNTTAELSLSLKDLGHEYAGNYAQSDIKDIRLIPSQDLLKYNLTDCLTTWFVYEKYYPVMLQDSQLNIYETIMLPSLKVIIQMELVGMPICLKRVAEVKQELLVIQAKHLDTIAKSKVVSDCEYRLKLIALTAINAKLKTKQHGMDKVANFKFNPNSPNQLTELLYETMDLPVLDKTKTGNPATGGDTLEKLINHTSNQEYKDVINALIGLSKVDKILTSFIPAFEQAVVKEDGHAYLHGSFNLGGTVSGRLSSSDPNLQNIPSGSEYGKLIKSCFKASNGWIFTGADFNSLEDYISALITKDPNKLAVYEKGFDGHCLRAAYYFREELPHIDLDNPTSVNSIKKTHPELRQKSKSPTFLLIYGGKHYGLMRNCGFGESEAKKIEANYHELYKVSDSWVAERIAKASIDGYATVAFGLRVRTPLLAKSILGTSKTLKEAEAEGRTVGNAFGQSYGLLNNRAAIEFMQRVWASPYKYKIFLVSLIHDSIYLIMQDSIEIVQWVNTNLIQCMQWQELPELKHPTVRLGANLDLYYPTWANPITLPNDAVKATIKNTIKEELLKNVKTL